MPHYRWAGAAAVVAVAAGLYAFGPAGLQVLFVAGPAFAQDSGETADVDRPKRHFKVERPADLTGAKALTIYDRLLDDMVAGYALSGDSAAERYRTWTRFNKVPYRSATHGERYVNNYANPAGQAYGKFEESGTLPQGTVLAKDSFAVTARGDVFSGPIFLMEKMAPGFKPEARDWRYSMIMPDGSIFGVTNGQDTERVEFCIACHEAAGDEQDHLFYIPEEFRQQVLKIDPKSN
jgi:hypothetical protein